MKKAQQVNVEFALDPQNKYLYEQVSLVFSCKNVSCLKEFLESL